MNDPSPHTVVRHTLIPPQPPTIQAATAWRATVRPARPRRHFDLAALAVCVALLAVLAVCVALLSAFVWTLHATPTPEPIAVAARAVTR
jgi:hypothetical protein